jgi:hypothetical protein
VHTSFLEILKTTESSRNRPRAPQDSKSKIVPILQANNLICWLLDATLGRGPRDSGLAELSVDI